MKIELSQLYYIICRKLPVRWHHAISVCKSFIDIVSFWRECGAMRTRKKR